MESSEILVELPAEEVTIDNQCSLEELIQQASSSNYGEILQRLAEEPSVVKRDMLSNELSKVLRVSRTAIRGELKKIIDANANQDNRDDNGQPGDGKTMTAKFPGLVDLVKDDSGKVVFLIKDCNELEMVTSWTAPTGETYCPPGAQYIKFPLVEGCNVMKHYFDLDGQQLFNDLLTYFKRFSYLDDDVWPIVILSVFLSYLQDHDDVRYIPVIYFYAVAQRGKSRTAKTFLSVCYRGIHLLDIRQANIVRFSQNLGATLFFDVTDLWKTAEKSDGTDILLGRFEKGCQVVRVLYPDKGPFADQVYFDVYGSTIVATNEPASPIFESRCISITMPNKPGIYENLLPEMGIELKERLTAWRAKYMDRPLPNVDVIPGLTGRLWEISEPLFRLAAIIAPAAADQMKNVLLDVSQQKAKDMKDTLEGQIVSAIATLAQFAGTESLPIKVEAIRTKVNDLKPEHFRISPQKIGKKIQSLSISTKQLNGYSHVVITRTELATLKEQYGIEDHQIIIQQTQLPDAYQDVAMQSEG